MELVQSEAIRIARLAGTKIKELRDKNLYKESIKDGYELVTTADLESNELIKTEILNTFPEHHILSEEDAEQKEPSINHPTWIIDPIDGTVGYANNQYQVAVSISFAVENKVRVGVVYNPFLEEMFYASEGHGAFLNNKQIQVKDVHDLRQSVIGTGFPHKRDDLREVIDTLQRILPCIGHEKVVDIALTELFSFKNHPFKVLDDETMKDATESVVKHGVLVPAIVRPREEGGYELISGHRRKRASELAGKDTMPVIIRKLDDDAATIIMVDSNIQRENILPSERAFAFKMKLDAIKRQGTRSDLTSGQVGQKLRLSVEIVADQAGESYKQVQRYIRLTELIHELLDMVDARKIAFNPAVELSYLRPDEQKTLLEIMDIEQATPSLSQAQRLKKFSQEGKLSADVMTAIMSEEKKPELDKVTLTGDKLKRYFPKSYTPQQMEETIIKLLENWSKKRQQSQER
jgi:ParB family chromosome partitioning protein